MVAKHRYLEDDSTLLYFHVRGVSPFAKVLQLVYFIYVEKINLGCNFISRLRINGYYTTLKPDIKVSKMPDFVTPVRELLLLITVTKTNASFRPNYIIINYIITSI